MSHVYTLILPVGTEVAMNQPKDKWVETISYPFLPNGPSNCQAHGVIYKTNDPVELALALGESLSQIHSHSTPNWVKKCSKSIFAPIIVISFAFLVFAFLTGILSTRGLDLLLPTVFFLSHLPVMYLNWLVFVSGPQYDNTHNTACSNFRILLWCLFCQGIWAW